MNNFPGKFRSLQIFKYKEKNGIYLQYSECSPLQRIHQHSTLCLSKQQSTQTGCYTIAACFPFEPLEKCITFKDIFPGPKWFSRTLQVVEFSRNNPGLSRRRGNPEAHTIMISCEPWDSVEWIAASEAKHQMMRDFGSTNCCETNDWSPHANQSNSLEWEPTEINDRAVLNTRFLQVSYSHIPRLFKSWNDNFPDLIKTVTLSHKC